jgi:hypothetical protein
VGCRQLGAKINLSRRDNLPFSSVVRSCGIAHWY